MQATSSEALVAMRTATGFRVYAPSDPKQTFMVSGTADEPVCTCPEFQGETEANPEFRCCHIVAVESQLPVLPPNGKNESYNRRVREEVTEQPRSGAQMVIKRAVSPDGRINSLSVEFTCPIDTMTLEAVRNHAAKTVSLQEEILDTFLNNNQSEPAHQNNGNGHENNNGNDRNSNGNGHNGNGNGNHTSRSDEGSGATPARLLDVGGMQTRVGWRTFINVEANGQTLKLFGSQKALCDYIAAAGFPDLGHNLNTGMRLDVPCRITTRQSDDGRYLNVERVFPAANGGNRGRSWQ